MAFKELTLNNFRCFKSTKIELSPGINFFYGKNGSGKTSLLEAIHLCSSGKSFKSSNLQALIAQGEDSFSLKSYDVDKGYILSVTKEKNKSISVLINNTKTTSSRLIREFPSTAIHNNTFSFADASPDFRRKILDRALFVSDKSFLENWFAYYRCLKQRNSLLKSGSISNIEPWDVKISEEGERLDLKRNDFFKATLVELNILINTIKHSASVNFLNDIVIDFFPGWDKSYELVSTMTNNRFKDLKRRTTTEGPHKADIRFLIGDVDARQILSRGEQKLFSILWCCAQHEVLRKQHNINATLIIDDIKSELDSNTFDIFLELLNTLNNQIIFSCIDDHFSSKIEANFREFKKFHVEQLR